MNRQSNSTAMDISFILLLIAIFTGVLFFAFDGGHIVQNGIIFCGATVVLLITYFTSLRAGLISTAAVLFLLAAYTLLRSAELGEPVPGYVYFWIGWLPAITIALALFVRKSTELRVQVKDLAERVRSQALFDEETGLKNLRFYSLEAGRAMGISRRFNLPLSLIVCKLQYEDEIVSSVSADEWRQLAQHISGVIAECVGEKEEVYLLGSKPTVWGALKFCDERSAGIYAKRVQKCVAAWKPIRRNAQSAEIPLTMVSGYSCYDGADMNAFSFLHQAKESFAQSEVAGLRFAQNFPRLFGKKGGGSPRGR